VHPNGFDRPTLIDKQPAYRLRLHVWWPERGVVIEDVHDHAWDFSSVIVAGPMRFTTFAAAENGEEYFAYPHTYNTPGAYSAGEVERCRLIRGLDVTMPAGTVYTFDHAQLHTVTVESDRPVATLVVAGSFRGNGSTVYTRHRRDAERFRQPSTTVTARSLRARLNHLEDYL
jgi:hypothetical protein